jgi:PKD repeat protein
MLQPFTNSNPLSLGLGDMDEDGRQDLIVGTASEMFLFRTRVDGSPDLPASILDRGASSIATADLNEDGHADFVASLRNGAAIVVATGTGSGTLASSYQIPVRSQVIGVSLADFNGDANLDVAAAFWSTASVAVALGNGDGTFGPVVEFAGGSHPTSLATGDINLDGFVDIVDIDDTTVGVRLGLGNGMFSTRIAVFLGGGSHSVSVAHVNSDGAPDLVVGNGSSQEAAALILIGNGDGTMRVPVPLGAPSYSTSTAVADMDGDGLVDVLMSLPEINKVALYSGDGAGAFSLSSIADGGRYIHPSVLLTSDMNLDGALDVAFTAHGVLQDNYQAAAGVVLGDGDGRLSSRVILPVGGSAQVLAVGRIDNNATDDLLVGATGTSQVSVFFDYQGATASQRVDLGTGPSPSQMISTDFNGDGLGDIVVLTNANGSTPPLANVFISNGNRTFRPRLDFQLSQTMTSMGMADLNQDGRPDLVAVSQTFNRLSVFINYLGVTLLPEATFSTGAGSSGPRTVTLADLDANGTIDAVVGFSSGLGLCTMLGDGAGGFAFSEDLPSGGAPSQILLTDLDSNGSPDIVMDAGGAIQWLQNSGAGQFMGRQSLFGVPGAPSAVVASDLTGDGLLDLALADPARQLISVHPAAGDGTFRQPINYGTDASPYGMAALDVDRDGGVDMVSLSASNSALSWFRNASVRAPVITAPTTVPCQEGSVCSFTVSATDPDGGLITTLDADVSALPELNDASFVVGLDNMLGTFSWTPTYGDAGSYLVVFHASNARLSSASTSLVIANVDRATTISPIADQAMLEGTVADVPVSAQDIDGESIALSLSGASFGTLIGEQTLPGLVSATMHLAPGHSDGGIYSAIVTATTGSATAAVTFSITVANANAAPSLTGPASVETFEGSLVSFTVTALDPDSDVVRLAAFNRPPGATFVDGGAGTGTFSWTPNFAQAGIYSLSFRATDAFGASGQLLAVTILVDDMNRPPVANAGGPYTGIVNLPISFDASASADPDGDALEILWSFGDGGNATGALAMHSYGAGGLYEVSVNVTDGTFSDATTTSASIQDVFPARAFVVGGNSTIRLGSGKATWCALIEPVAGSFLGTAVIPSSVSMSYGSGRIFASAGKVGLGSDKDANGIAEISACFSKSDLRVLFEDVPRGTSTVSVVFEGDLSSGGMFRASMPVNVVGTGGNLVASVSPNPLSRSGTLTFETSRPGRLRVRLFDLQGRLVRRLASEERSAAGYHDVHLDGLFEDGRRLPSGIYFYRIDAAEGAATGRVTVAR